MSKILYTFKDFDENGGAEKNLLEVAQHASKNNGVYFVVTSCNGSEKMKNIGKLFILPSKGRILLFPLDALYILYITQKYDIDIIHSHHRYPTFISSIVKPFSKIKLLTTVHNVFPDKASFKRWGDHAIAVSQSVYEWVISDNKYPKHKISVIYNGISTPPRYNKEELQDIRNEIGFDKNCIYLCSVGRLSEQKNYSLLFELISKIKTDNWRLLLVGSGEEKESLVDLAKVLKIENKIIFLGQRSDIHKIMQISDLFVLSSLWEGFPYVVIEALANGLPVVSTDVGGIHEAITDGETGYLFQLDEMSKYIDTLTMLISNKESREMMSSNCRRVFMENFTIDKMLIKTDDIYQQLQK